MAPYFLLYSNCIITKGFSRSIVTDLQNGFYVFISNELADHITMLRKHPIKKYLELNSAVKKSVLELELNKLIDLDLGHYVTDPNLFPEISKEFNSPFEIQDCIIELSRKTYIHRKKILTSLTILGCQSLELRAYDFCSVKMITDFLELINNTRIRGVEIYIPFNKNLHPSLEQIIRKYQVISKIIIHSCDDNLFLTSNVNCLFYVRQKINSSSCCGKISPELFIVNLPFYIEAKNQNSCLSRKISIDADGNLKNCPSIKDSYGNIEYDDLKEVVKKEGFRRLWSINKDKISTCKDCEFRYICSDCRAYVKSEKDKPINCKYDPYTASYSS